MWIYLAEASPTMGASHRAEYLRPLAGVVEVGGTFAVGASEPGNELQLLADLEGDLALQVQSGFGPHHLF